MAGHHYDGRRTTTQFVYGHNILPTCRTNHGNDKTWLEICLYPKGIRDKPWVVAFALLTPDKVHWRNNSDSVRSF